MITHKNIVGNVLKTIIYKLGQEIGNDESGSTIPVVPSSISEVATKPSVVVSIVNSKNSTKNRYTGGSVGFLDYIDPALPDNTYEYVNSRCIEVDISITGYADSNHSALFLEGAISDFAHSIFAERVPIAFFNDVTPSYNVLPHISPKIAIDDLKYLSSAFDSHAASNSYTATVRFPVTVAFAEPVLRETLLDITTTVTPELLI